MVAPTAKNCRTKRLVRRPRQRARAAGTTATATLPVNMTTYSYHSIKRALCYHIRRVLIRRRRSECPTLRQVDLLFCPSKTPAIPLLHADLIAPFFMAPDREYSIRSSSSPVPTGPGLPLSILRHDDATSCERCRRRKKKVRTGLGFWRVHVVLTLPVR